MFAFLIVGSEAGRLDQSGIYEWTIEGAGNYIGKSKRLRSRLLEYPNNVRRLLAGLPNRKGRPTVYRLIHHELFRAFVEQRAISLTVVENCAADQLSAHERYWIACRAILNR